MKRLLLLICAFITSIPAWGSECGCFDGFYLGVAGGIATHMADGHLNTQSGFPGVSGSSIIQETLTNNYHFDVCNNRGWGEIFGGWGHQCNCFYLGGRLGVNFSRYDLKVKSHIANVDTNASDEGNAFLDDSLRTKMNNAEFTFDLKPGWIFCSRSMLFGIIGGAVNRVTLRGESQLNKLAGTFIPAATFDLLTFRKRKTTTGFRTGFGLEQMLTRCLSLQISYVYTWYGKVKKNASQIFTAQVGTLPPQSFVHSADFEVKPRKQVTSIGLAYYF